MQVHASLSNFNRKQRLVASWLLLLVWWPLCSFATLAATPLADYQNRVTQAVQIAQELAEHPPAMAATDESLKQLQRLKQLLPPQEEVTAAEQVIQVDNRWLHELLAAPDPNPARLAELAARLTVLQQRLTTHSASRVSAGETPPDRLTRILARPEYQTSQMQQSVIKRWLDRVWQRVRDLLRQLFGSRPAAQAKPNQITVNLVRVLIVGLLCLALFYALFKLFQRIGARQRRTARETGTREILGEQINEQTTTEDLLASARALAQQGDYRAAIRRAYIALLYELEQQGKLHLHQAKTNRDYLNALREEQAIYPSFVALTRIFERIWYGRAGATEFDFEGFLTGYREAVNRE